MILHNHCSLTVPNKPSININNLILTSTTISLSWSVPIDSVVTSYEVMWISDDCPDDVDEGNATTTGAGGSAAGSGSSGAAGSTAGSGSSGAAGSTAGSGSSGAAGSTAGSGSSGAAGSTAGSGRSGAAGSTAGSGSSGVAGSAAGGAAGSGVSAASDSESNATIPVIIYTIHGLRAGTTYTITVIANNGAGASSNDTVITGTPEMGKSYTCV